VDVQRLEQAVSELRARDYRYGGGSCRAAVEARLPQAEALLEGSVRESLVPRLYTVVADLYNLAGWTSFDENRPDAALAAFGHALELAVEAGNEDLKANIRYRTGRVRLHYGAVDAALDEFAQGQLAARLAGSKLAQAILTANQAWAYAKKADVAAALTHLARARAEFADAGPVEPTPWEAFFDPNDMAAMMGTVHAELAQHVDVRYGREGIPALVDAIAGYGPSMSRSRSLTVIWLATIHTLDGDLDVAGQLGREAIAVAAELQSPRTRQRLQSLSTAAQRFPRDDEARELVEGIAALDR
jgi:tetratricopeptide (TPR) repeat protein